MQHGTIGRFVFATLLVALGTTSSAAAIDLSGDYVGSALGTTATLTVVQTGTTLQSMGEVVVNSTTYPLSATGTVDPATGEFSVAGEITGLCPDFVYSGTGDGEEITGTFTSPTCPSGPVSLTKCGNGVLDPLENCEDGNHVDGDCCSARCRLDPAGTGCTSDGNDCTDDVCNATGACTHVPNAGPCEDGNACTIGDVCAAGACVPGSPAPAGEACEDDFDPCTADICDAAGTCTHVPVPRAACRRAVACHSTCTQQLVECKRTCPGRGQARRDCRAACAARSTCTAPGARIRTLAYVLSECRVDAAGFVVARQALRIRRGDCEPITAVEFPPSEPVRDPQGLCLRYGQALWGSSSVVMFPLQRLGVSPDGSGVVFEVSDEFSITAPSWLSPEQEGIFFVRSDGQGLRRLGPASRDPSFRIGQDFISGMRDFWRFWVLSPPILFSPNGRRIAFTDLGPGPGGEEAVQIVVLDLATDPPKRTQTHLPSGTPPQVAPGESPYFLTCCPKFIDDETILFQTFVDPDGSNPEHNFAAFTVRIDGSRLKPVPTPVSLPDSHLVPSFAVTGLRTNLIRLSLPETPVNPNSTFPITEVFLQDGKNLLQLTKFRREDTFLGFLNPTRTRAFFLASADPLGKNREEYCQVFSMDTLGTGLRQVTHLNSRVCPALFGTGCFQVAGIGYGYYRVIFQDPVTEAVVFDSACDPLGANRFGYQLFAMRPDGHGLRQLTDASGFTTNPDGSIRVEFPGPFAYSAALH